MQTWLVTGANGFLGANAGVYLRDKAKCIGLVRNSLPVSCERIIDVDLLDFRNLTNVVHQTHPQVILHTAALASHEQCEKNPDLALEVNAGSTKILAAAARDIGAKFIYISTDSVFDGAIGNYTESDAPSPFSTYGISKLLGENHALEVNPEALVLRTNFFGWSPTGSKSILEFFVKSLRENSSVPGYLNFRVTTLYIQDLLEIIWQLSEKSVSGIVNVASRDSLSKFDFGVKIAEELQLDPALITPVEAPIRHEISRDRDLSLNTDYCRTLLGRNPSTQISGIRRALREEANLTKIFQSLRS